MKIVSLVPSLTETLFDFGFTKKEMVGRTKFCIHPKILVKDIPIMGGTKNLNIEKIIGLKPDLVLANKEENVKEQVEQISHQFKVLVTDTKTLEENRTLLSELGELLQKTQQAQKFNDEIKTIFDHLKPKNAVKTAYLIWKNPYMTVGGDTFISDILKNLSFQNIFKNQKRYPIVELSDLEEAECIMLSSEPFPFKQKHLSELRAVFPHKKILLVDGEAFSWYGTHLSKCKNYFEHLIADYERG